MHIAASEAYPRIFISSTRAAAGATRQSEYHLDAGSGIIPIPGDLREDCRSFCGAALIFLVLLDTFETILQPRRVTHRFRFARFFYRWNWTLCTLIARQIPSGKRREALLSFFGPLSLLGLFVVWVSGLIFGFALLGWSIPTALQTADQHVNFLSYLYMSGTTFFTLGYGDITPTGHFGRVLAVVESGLGFAFLAVIISYLPGINQAFSKREVTISLLDARAGSPPTAAQVLVRVARADNLKELNSLLVEWEQWSAELLESHLSFPVLSYFRSQHDNQSWLAALTCMLDTCAVLIAEAKGCNLYRVQLTFAMARHAAVDLSLIFNAAPEPPRNDRMPAGKTRATTESAAGRGPGIARQQRSGREIDGTSRHVRAVCECAGAEISPESAGDHSGRRIDRQLAAQPRNAPGTGNWKTVDRGRGRGTFWGVRRARSAGWFIDPAATGPVKIEACLHFGEMKPHAGGLRACHQGFGGLEIAQDRVGLLKVVQFGVHVLRQREGLSVLRRHYTTARRGDASWMDQSPDL